MFGNYFYILKFMLQINALIETFTNFRKPSQICNTNNFLIGTSVEFSKNTHTILLQNTFLKETLTIFFKYSQTFAIMHIFRKHALFLFIFPKKHFFALVSK